MAKKETVEFVVGMAVVADGYGTGEIVGRSENDGENGTYPVFHVKLENGQVRNFTAGQLSL
jgi:hypothetical protein